MLLLIVVVFLAGCITQQSQITGKVTEPLQIPKEQVTIEPKTTTQQPTIQEKRNETTEKPYRQPPTQTTIPTTTTTTTTQPSTTITITQSAECKGSARCFIGNIDEITDGDTLEVGGYSIRLALTSTPELYQSGGEEAKQFTANLCAIDSKALADEDDGQTEGSYGRIVAVVYCQNKNLNAELLYNDLAQVDTRFCSESEFSNEEWAKSHCFPTKSNETETNCHSSYPTVCIPYPPPDLDCSDISYRNFQVLSPDPHRFDVDKDGIGCES